MKKILVCTALVSICFALSFTVGLINSAPAATVQQNAYGGCTIDYWTMPVVHLNPGDGISVAGYASCPVTITNTWDSEVRTSFRANFTIPVDTPSGVYYIYMDSEGVHKEITVVVGDVEPLPVDLGLSIGNVYWESMQDYENGLLTAEYIISNIGSNDAYNVILTGSSATNDVVVMACPGDLSWSCLPKSMGNILAGQQGSGAVKYYLPPGTSSFETTNAASAKDAYGFTHDYPGP